MVPSVAIIDCSALRKLRKLRKLRSTRPGAASTHLIAWTCAKYKIMECL